MHPDSKEATINTTAQLLGLLIACTAPHSWILPRKSDGKSKTTDLRHFSSAKNMRAENAPSQTHIIYTKTQI